MSKEIDIIKNTGVKSDRDLQITEFWSGEENGTMIQLTQGFGGVDGPGYIQLTIQDYIKIRKFLDDQYFNSRL